MKYNRRIVAIAEAADPQSQASALPIVARRRDLGKVVPVRYFIWERPDAQMLLHLGGKNKPGRMSTQTTVQDDHLLPSLLKQQLWLRIGRRLDNGEVLITTEQFQRAMTKEFKRLVKTSPNWETKKRICKMIMTVNDEYPETYLTLGIKNAVSKFFRNAKESLGGEGNDVVEESKKRIKQMIKNGKSDFFLESIGVDIGNSGVPRSIERAIEKIVDGQKLHAAPEVQVRSPQRRRATNMVDVRVAQAQAGQDPADQEVGAPPPSREEEQERIREDKERLEALSTQELKRAPSRLDSFVEQKLLTDEEVVSLRDLYGIDERLEKGEIDQAEADSLRGQIDANVQSRLQERLEEAVDYSVHYLNAFEALRRLPEPADDAVRFLIEHKMLVVTEDADADFSVPLKELEGNTELLEQVAEVMERKHHEVRMIVANLPPYRYITKGGKVANLVIDNTFVEELRSLSTDDLSDRLNAADAEVRVKPAADMKCFVALIQEICRETAFHAAIRRLKIKLTMTRIYSSTSDGKDGRRKLQQFLRQRLPRQYPNLSRDERAEIEEDGKVVMEGGGEGAADENAPKEKMRVYRA